MDATHYSFYVDETDESIVINEEKLKASGLPYIRRYRTKSCNSSTASSATPEANRLNGSVDDSLLATGVSARGSGSSADHSSTKHRETVFKVPTPISGKTPGRVPVMAPRKSPVKSPLHVDQVQARDGTPRSVGKGARSPWSVVSPVARYIHENPAPPLIQIVRPRKSPSAKGIEHIFGVVGVPVFEVALAAQQAGIKFVGMHNEQAWPGVWAKPPSTKTDWELNLPGVCLVVSGPGLVHALGGLANAQINAWPLLLVGGSCEQNFEGLGAFQEFPQVDACRMYTKYTCRPGSVQLIPMHIEKAVRTSLYGRPGATYIDLPGNMIMAEVPEESVPEVAKCPDPPRTLADPPNVVQALSLLKNAKKPLIIVGKGAAYARAEKSVRELVECTGLPYLPTPMGKGVLPDNHPQCISPARSK
ncbi:hypothetical protein HPB52_016893 [Rhipicephalus sanguineus]|uniref:Oxalyl-CoA decarboxylase n=1 Tax=Rhipicephalus sanguineus TaxID=34632 RepID=A0A9D4Q128_RHISA|nr:hypothetical protein HPB52_016893 [Rhipicephalus sanguineus]